MDFDASHEQRSLAENLERFLRDRYSFQLRQAAAASAAGWRRDLWQSFAQELDLLGAGFAESVGGHGGGAIENMIVMEAFGRALVIEPYWSTVVVAGGLLKHAGGAVARQRIADIVAGRHVYAFAYAEPQGRFDAFDLATRAERREGGWVVRGRKSLVIDAPYATHLMLVARTAGAARDRSGVSLFEVPIATDGLRRSDYATADGRRASELWLDDCVLPEDALVGPQHEALPLIERVLDEAIAALCAEAVGCMRAMIDQTIQYGLQRRQFGQPIAQFQAVQHRYADMHVALEQSVSAMYLATLNLESLEGKRAAAVSAAKAIVGKAARFIGQNAIQLHGGMGMTDELAVGHYFRRVTMIDSQLGSVDQHLERWNSNVAAAGR
ncbi:MAG: pimeloyl-CoA dehydrogenase small subunit [Hydrocarboniphaga sp.]|uniref:acyl-CoA dehydrogenase family protein n=1 Tax=Hydrocarboniphaga sp. TaxID=2033016 RepID=UPI0026194B6F|nr:acyl-CoA dehydrogenase family protein [Hydrocarboniphaga sp.]MDB5969953.1 pimeloyl-CoA dehydrogenase small subunit [Hydrocarboniphaga sp.]